jgi:hypothetical protein
VQHTPNPAAQDPLELPPLSEHSDDVKQVPFLLAPEDVVKVLEHGSFSKFTMLKSENTFPSLLLPRSST